MNIQKHFDLLGLKVRDCITGMSGVVCSLSFDLYGCIQAAVHPGQEKDGTKLADSYWFDISRLEILDKTPVMARPQFEFTPEAITQGSKGPADKPPFCKA